MQVLSQTGDTAITYAGVTIKPQKTGSYGIYVGAGECTHGALMAVVDEYERAQSIVREIAKRAEKCNKTDSDQYDIYDMSRIKQYEEKNITY